MRKAFNDEMLFVLMARDETSPAVVMEWIKMNLHKQPVEKLREAFECAMTMLETRPSILVKKEPKSVRVMFYNDGGFPVTVQRLIFPKGSIHGHFETIISRVIGLEHFDTDLLEGPTQYKVILHCPGAPCEYIYVIDPVDSTATLINDWDGL